MNKQNIIRGNREISTSKISSINDLEITRMLQMVVLKADSINAIYPRIVY